MKTFRVWHGAAELGAFKAESDYQAARKVARRLGYRGEPENCSMSGSGAQSFRFLPRRRQWGTALVLKVLEAEPPTTSTPGGMP